MIGLAVISVGDGTIVTALTTIILMHHLAVIYATVIIKFHFAEYSKKIIVTYSAICSLAFLLIGNYNI